jgi:hypothetical protein
MVNVVEIEPLHVAEMLAEVVAPTEDVLIGNVPVIDPAPTVTLAGTTAAASLLYRVTTAPPAGAGPVSVTVPVAEAPPVRLAGLNATELTEAAATKTTSRK